MKVPNDPLERQRLREALARKRSQQGIRPFLDEVKVELADKTVKSFKDAKEPWQDDLLNPLIPAVEAACGLRKDYHGPRKFYLTQPKSHAKTTHISLLSSWVTSSAPQYTRLLTAAGDQKQAGFLLEAAQMIHRENAFLHPIFNIVQYKATGPGGLLTIESSEAFTKSGVLADIIVCDELTFWPDLRGKALYEVFDATTVKRPNVVLIIITNAGILDSWQHKLLEHAKRHPELWYVSDEPGRKAKWLSEAAIADARANMLPSHAKRVFDNIWSRPDEEGTYLTREEVLAVTDPNHGPTETGTRGIDYYLSMDYGSVKDRATAAVLHQDPATQHVILDRLYIHQGSKEARTPIELMLEWGDEARRDFHIKELWLDPNQLEAVAQQYEGVMRVKRYAFQGDGHHKMAENLRNLIQNKRIKLYPNAAPLRLPNGTTESLIDELAALVVEPLGHNGRYRVNHRPGLHDDRYTSLALGALATVSRPQRYDLHEVLDEMIATRPTRDAVQTEIKVLFPNPSPETETAAMMRETKHTEIHYLQAYGTWQARPILRGVPTPLSDHKDQHRAAYAVNYAHMLLDEPLPNEVPEDKLNDEVKAAIEASVLKQLTHRKLYVPPKAAPKQPVIQSPKEQQSTLAKS